MSTGTDVWSAKVAPSPEPPVVRDAVGRLVATLHAPRAQAAFDAVLVAHAPTMLSALRRCAETFQVMADCDPGPSGRVAASMHAQLDELLRGAVGVWEDGPRAIPGGAPG